MDHGPAPTSGEKCRLAAGASGPASQAARTRSTTSSASSPDFSEIHGDRLFGGEAIPPSSAASGLLRQPPHHGDRSAAEGPRRQAEAIHRNFGMPKPEGATAKALRVMQLAAKFGRPVVTFLDTPGRLSRVSTPRSAAGRGAIARNLREMSRLDVAGDLRLHRRGRQRRGRWRWASATRSGCSRTPSTA